MSFPPFLWRLVLLYMFWLVPERLGRNVLQVNYGSTLEDSSGWTILILVSCNEPAELCMNTPPSGISKLGD